MALFFIKPYRIAGEHHCAFCETPTAARNYAAQSTDRGKTVTWVWACDAHVADWNEGGDWVAPAYVRARQLRSGDPIDLEDDPFADPNGNNPAFECEYALVDHVERETADCVAVGIEGFDVVGFPIDHMIRINVD